jgi:putative membrane protein
MNFYKLIDKNSFYNYLKGMGMGIADIIPGISGGTVALILGIYSDFINSIRSFNLDSISYIINLDFKKLSHQINLPFLIPVILGIITSIISFSFLVSYLLEFYREVIFSFFFGLILFSASKIILNLSPSSKIDFLQIFLGISFGYAISLIDPIGTGQNYFSIFFSGLIAITAMLLPGISGSYILLILGKYDLIINSLSNFDYGVILVFSSGAVIGVLLFSRIISMLLSKYFRKTILFLSGLMLGALNKLWPWQIDNENYLPDEYSNILGVDNFIEFSIILFLISFLISFLIKSVK